MSRAGAAFDQLAERWLRRWKIPGLSLAVVERGRAPFLRGFGYRDRAAHLAATPRTVYGLASVTKSFTALAILRLEEEGRLSTGDPVVRHLPAFGTPEPRWTRRITLQHFLTHTSGLPPLPSVYYTAIRSFTREPPYDPRVARRVGVDPDHAPIDTYAQLMEYLRTTRYRLLGPPGTRFSYSNEAFGLLGAVVEEVTGRSYESYLEESVLRPLGMRSTTFDTGIMRRSPEVTVPYSRKRTGARHPLVPSPDWWEEACLRACGGLRTNVEDFARYLEMLSGEGKLGRERLFRAASIRRMFAPHVPVSPGLFYGYGVAVRPDYHGVPLVFHDGALPGVTSFFALVPGKGVGAVVLANAEQVRTRGLLLAALHPRLGLSPRAPFDPLPPRTTGAVPLGDYEGSYASGEGISAQVRASRGGLRLDFHGIELTERGLRFEPVGDDRFVIRIPGFSGAIRFERDPRGRVWAVFLGWRLVRRRTPRELRGARFGRVAW
ncbi:MAG: serine hydrolase [Thermoplasmata archaeon]